jgi:hypothetical protein
MAATVVDEKIKVYSSIQAGEDKFLTTDVF